MNLLSTIGRGIKGAGRGILSGIDNAAVGSLTGGGLMDAALGSNGQPFTPTDQQRKGLRGQYLMGIGSALQQGRPIAEGIQQYQQNAIGQIQAGQQAQQQAKSRQVQQEFNQEMQAANGVESKLAVVGKYSSALGPAATKQYADAITSMRAPKEDAPFVPVGDLGYLNKQTGQFQAIPKAPGAPPTPERQTFDALVQEYGGDQTKAFAELQAMLKPQQPQREGNPTEASLAMAAANGDKNAARALQLLRPQNAPHGNGGMMKMAPPSVITGVTQNNRNLRTIDDALAELKTDPNATGYKGFAPEFLLNRFDPKGTNARAAIANIGSLQIHDRTGAAMTPGEAQRLIPFIPSATDDLATVKKKLFGLRGQIKGINDDISQAYSEEYKPLPQYVGTQQQQPQGIPAIGQTFNGGKVLKVTRIP